MGVSDAGPEPSILSLTALSLPVLHSWSAGARVVATFAVDRGITFGSSALGQQGHLPAISERSQTQKTPVKTKTATARSSLRGRMKCVRDLQTSLWTASVGVLHWLPQCNMICRLSSE